MATVREPVRPRRWIAEPAIAPHTLACTKCGERKPIQHFAKRSDGGGIGSGGYRSACRACATKQVLAWYRVQGREPVRVAAIAPHTLPCSVCGQRKPIQDFTVDRRMSGRGGRSSTCYVCFLVKRREYYAANPEKYRARGRESSKKNRQANSDRSSRYRARQRSSEWEVIDRLAIYDRDSGICHICGTKVPRSKFTLDHLIPVVKGGPHVATNLRVAHHSCNSRRGPGRLPAQLLLIG